MKKYDIFISYSRKDSAIAEQVTNVFNAYKAHYVFEYFFDREEITSRQEYLARIADAIYESNVMLFLASKNSYESDFCSKEILFADKYKVKTHIYCIDNTTPPRKVELLLIDQHFLEMALCPIEKMVQQVLADALDVEIKPLSELSHPKVSKEKEDLPQERVVRSVATEESTQVGPDVKPIDVLSVVNPFVGMVRAGVEIYKAVKEQGSEQDQKSTPTPKTYKVGDYYDDGTKKGVVFDVWDGGRHGKIVSLDKSANRLQWCTNEQYDKDIVVGADSKSNGKANTDKVMARGDADQYPAFAWCRNKGVDWYLPAIDELKLLLLNDAVHDAVNLTLKQKGATPLFNKVELKWYWYWSSSEYGEYPEFYTWYVLMSDGNAYKRKKDDYSCVRAVSVF